MNVALCDDDIMFLNKLEETLSSYECNTFTFQTLNELLNSNIIFDIAFLDIELDNNTTGFQAVAYLRELKENCVIAFFTSYNQYAIKGYEYQAYRYILKSEPEILINKRIDEIFQEYHRQNKNISGSYNGYSFSTPINEIFYISISNHVITVHSKKGDFELYKKLKDLELELSKAGFVRCHRSYMVNIKHILVMRSDYYFILNDKKRTSIPIGIRYRDVAENKYLNSISIGGN